MGGRCHQIVAVRDMPWYATVLFMPQPLNFGANGGLPLKIKRALLDVVTIVLAVVIVRYAKAAKR